MRSPSRSPAAGGALIAIGAIGGAAIGFVQHQPTLWLIAGIAIGVIAAVAVWLLDLR